MIAVVDSAGYTDPHRSQTQPSALQRFTLHLKRRSIRLLLSAASLVFLLQVVGLGSFSIQRLNDLNRVSEEIRNEWLQDTRLLGDLNNYMSDYRTAEATYLLSTDARELQASERDIRTLDATVSRAQRAYEGLAHQAQEQSLYSQFASQWLEYKVLAAQVLALSRSGRRAEAVAMYMGTSRHAFDGASDTLGALTDQTVARAREASGRAASVYATDRRLIAAAIIVAAFLVIATLIYITRSVSGPILGLARRMRALAAHDTDITVPGERRDDEVGEMARSVLVFRANAIALVKSQQRLADQAAALEAALEKERRLTSQQRNFITMTSHEFRTPLTVIDAQAQRLIKLKDRVSAADLLERASRIRGAVVRLTGLMDSLLGASSLFDGLAVYHPSEIAPGALLHEVCQLHRDTTRGADIREDFASLPELMSGDPKLLFAMLSNLLSNAIKYSRPGSPVTLGAHAQDADTLLITVRDQGIGIPERDRAHLFERYFRGSNASGITGSGVGLHLVSMVLSLHGGRIEVDSQESIGSTFTIHLPVRAQDPAQAAASVEAAS